MTDFKGQPEPLPAAHHQHSKLLGLGDSVTRLADSSLSTQSPRWPQSLSILPPGLWYPPQKTDAHPNTQPIPSFAVDCDGIIIPVVEHCNRSRDTVG